MHGDGVDGEAGEVWGEPLRNAPRPLHGEEMVEGEDDVAAREGAVRPQALHALREELVLPGGAGVRGEPRVCGDIAEAMLLAFPEREGDGEHLEEFGGRDGVPRREEDVARRVALDDAALRRGQDVWRVPFPLRDIEEAAVILCFREGDASCGEEDLRRFRAADGLTAAERRLPRIAAGVRVAHNGAALEEVEDGSSLFRPPVDVHDGEDEFGGRGRRGRGKKS